MGAQQLDGLLDWPTLLEPPQGHVQPCRDVAGIDAQSGLVLGQRLGFQRIDGLALEQWPGDRRGSRSQDWRLQGRRRCNGRPALCQQRHMRVADLIGIRLEEERRLAGNPSLGLRPGFVSIETKYGHEPVVVVGAGPDLRIVGNRQVAQRTGFRQHVPPCPVVLPLHVHRGSQHEIRGRPAALERRLEAALHDVDAGHVHRQPAQPGMRRDIGRHGRQLPLSLVGSPLRLQQAPEVANVQAQTPLLVHQQLETRCRASRRGRPWPVRIQAARAHHHPRRDTLEAARVQRRESVVVQGPGPHGLLDERREIHVDGFDLAKHGLSRRSRRRA